MNTVKLAQMLDSYVKDFDMNWKNENYKWIEVKNFQQNFNIGCEPVEFVDMLKRAIRTSSNLYASHRYYPIDEIIHNAEKYPAEVQQAFVVLLDEEKDIYDRVEEYRSRIEAVKKKTGLTSRDGQDIRFISTFLSFKYPEKYTIYKFTEISKFCEQFETGIKIKAGATESIQNTILLINLLIDYLKETDHPVLKLYEEKRQKPAYYKDESLRLFAQNIIWYATKYLPDDAETETPAISETSFQHGNLKKSFYQAKPEKKE